MSSPYGSVIAERFRRPRFRGPLPGADGSAEAFNPLCGDRIRIELSIGQNIIAAARHVGDACAICVAAADVLSEMIEGASTSDAAALSTEQLIARLESTINPSRVQCVALPLTALRQALDDLRRNTSRAS
jgi:nitrogen fixation NifU-like protein